MFSRVQMTFCMQGSHAFSPVPIVKTREFRTLCQRKNKHPKAALLGQIAKHGTRWRLELYIEATKDGQNYVMGKYTVCNVQKL